eukprot:gene10673-11840_t
MESLSSPEDFHKALLHGLRTAKQSITFSALYVGVSKEREKEFVAALREALTDSNRPNLRVRFILDHSRAHRDSAAFLSTFRQLLEEFSPRLEVFLYEMPSLRHLLLRRLPAQWREVLGVYHVKFMVFDEEVILTGSNLSEEYFVNRQDRYLLLRRPALRSLLQTFADIVSQDAHIMRHDTIESRPDRSVWVREELRRLVQSFEVQQGEGLLALPLIQCADLALHDEEQTLQRLLSNSLPLPLSSASSPSPEEVPRYCLDRVTIMSPYPNFSVELLTHCRHLLLHRLLHTQQGKHSVQDEVEEQEEEEPGVFVVTADTSSHGFANGAGVKRYIPHLHQTVLSQTVAAADAEDLRLGLYYRQGWTFHGKGLWLTGRLLAAKHEHVVGRLSGCYIGSSNMSSRSHSRDFELGVLFLQTTSGSSSASHCGERPAVEKIFRADLANITRHLIPLQGVSDPQQQQELRRYVSTSAVAKRSAGGMVGWERWMVQTVASLVKTFL